MLSISHIPAHCIHRLANTFVPKTRATTTACITLALGTLGCIDTLTSKETTIASSRVRFYSHLFLRSCTVLAGTIGVIAVILSREALTATNPDSVGLVDKTIMSMVIGAAFFVGTTFVYAPYLNYTSHYPDLATRWQQRGMLKIYSELNHVGEGKDPNSDRNQGWTRIKNSMLDIFDSNRLSENKIATRAFFGLCIVLTGISLPNGDTGREGPSFGSIPENAALITNQEDQRLALGFQKDEELTEKQVDARLRQLWAAFHPDKWPEEQKQQAEEFFSVLEPFANALKENLAGVRAQVPRRLAALARD